MRKRKQVKILMIGPVYIGNMPGMGLNCPQCGAPKVMVSLFRIVTMLNPFVRAGYHYACGMKTRCLFYPDGVYTMKPGWHVELVADCSIVGKSPRVN